MEISKRKLIAIVGILLLLVATVTYVAAQSSSITVTISGGVYPGALSYTVWVEDGVYFAKNSSGAIEFSGTNAATVIQACINELTSGGVIFIKQGLYLISQNLVISGINSEGITIIGEGVGSYDSPKPPYSQCGTELRATTGCTKVVEMLNSRWLTMRDLTLSADDIADYCFYADNVNNTHGGEADIYIDNVNAWGVPMGKTNHTIAPVRILNSIVIRITNCFFHHGYAALWLGACSDIWVINCDLEGAVVGLLSEFSHHLDIVSVKLEYNVASQANTDYAGTTNAAAIGLYYMDKYIKMQNVIINEFMLHGIKMSSDVISVEMVNVVIHQLPSSAPIGTSYGIWNQGCDRIIASNVEVWDESGNTDIAIYDQGNNNTWTNVRVENCSAPWSFTGSGYRVSNWNINGKPIERSGTATEVSPIVITHGLAGTPTSIVVTPKDNIVDQFCITIIGATTFRIVHNYGESTPFYWYAEYKP